MKVDLPEELIGEILLRLPVKALLRFKSVCKEWCALIGIRRFIVGHYGHESNADCQLIESLDTMRICGDDGSVLQSEASKYLSQMHMCDYLMGPANGIFCAIGRDIRHIALLNPATRKLKPLPPFPLERLGYLVCGFGIDPFHGDFKVVVFTQRRRQRNFLCVYNSSSDSWSKTDLVGWINDVVHMIFPNGVFSNGVYYWIMGNKSVVGFDMRSEKFHEILPPDAREYCNLRLLHITAYGDSIALVSHEYYISRCVDCWVMGRDGLWGKCVRIHLPQLISYVDTVYVWNKNELLLNTITESETRTLFLCDISTQKLREFRADFEGSDYYKVYYYKESLLSFKGETHL